MSIFRVTVCLGGGNNIQYPGLFATSKEAQDQAYADYPNARGVSVILIKGANHA